MTSPTPLKKKLSRLWVFEVDTGPEGAPSWTRVNGLTSATLTISPTEVDVSDFDSEGWQDNLTTFRSWALALAGWDGYTGPDNAPVDDPGQTFLKAAGLLTGAAAYANIQFYRSDTGKGYTGRVTVNYGGAGGEVKAAEAMSFNLTGSGACTALTVTP